MALQTIRLAGVADIDAIADRAYVADDVMDRILAEAGAEERCSGSPSGDSSGWVLTDAGAARLAALLDTEVAGHDAAPVLADTLATFEPLNERFVGLISRWQLQSTSSTNTRFGDAGTVQVHDLLTSRSCLGSDVRDVLRELIRVLPPVRPVPGAVHGSGAAGRPGRAWLGRRAGAALLPRQIEVSPQRAAARLLGAGPGRGPDLPHEPGNHLQTLTRR